ncbi:hypothetical protein VEx25_1565 [Vibrio antiquarius]|uniref:Uncharacterized protein n=1 Tax=Vibrio antiquarius (strain Ex25) TaxID=150340 RepID=A0ABM9WU93_VIBAE|nr:hypothetical protein VEx25_1565 [Vibrio antiquarius]
MQWLLQRQFKQKVTGMLAQIFLTLILKLKVTLTALQLQVWVLR